MERKKPSRAAEAALVREVLQSRTRADAAFQALVEPHLATVRTALLRLTNGDRMRTEDLLQETLLSAWSRLKTFRGESSFGTWLYRIAVNTFRMNMRYRASRLLDQATDLILAETVAAPGPSVLHRLECEDLGRCLSDAVAALPDPLRVTLLCWALYGEEEGQTTLAVRLGVSIGTFKSRLFRARWTLRRSLRENAQQDMLVSIRHGAHNRTKKASV